MTEAVIDPLNDIIHRIRDAIDPEKIILFGSRANNRGFSEDSDYDIFILLDGQYNKRKIRHKLYRILSGVGVSVDILVETNSDFNKFKMNKYLIYYHISREGRIIYEK